MLGTGLLVAAAGVFSCCGAGFDWDWFMGSSKARLIVMILGRTGGRIFYGLLGAALVIGGIVIALSPERP
jgi:hypothetical protein